MILSHDFCHKKVHKHCCMNLKAMLNWWLWQWSWLILIEVIIIIIIMIKTLKSFGNTFTFPVFSSVFFFRCIQVCARLSILHAHTCTCIYQFTLVTCGWYIWKVCSLVFNISWKTKGNICCPFLWAFTNCWEWSGWWPWWLLQTIPDSWKW